jgi:hypothetical protein
MATASRKVAVVPRGAAATARWPSQPAGGGASAVPPIGRFARFYFGSSFGSVGITGAPAAAADSVVAPLAAFLFVPPTYPHPEGDRSADGAKPKAAVGCHAVCVASADVCHSLPEQPHAGDDANPTRGRLRLVPP